MMGATLVSLFIDPIPTLNDGMTIGDTIDVIVVALDVVVVIDWLELEAFTITLELSKTPVSDVGKTLLAAVEELLGNISLVGVDIETVLKPEVTVIESS